MQFLEPQQKVGLLLHEAPIKPPHVVLSALSAAYSKLFSLYFQFLGEPR